MDLTTGFLLLLIGILAGGYGTIVGAGGGFIFVPALLLLFKMEPAIAAGSGLIIVLINSLSGVVGYAKQEKIQYRTGLTLAIGALPGSFLGVWLLQLYSSSYFYVIFATLLVGLGIFLFTKNLPNKLKRRQPSEGYAYIAAGASGESEVSVVRRGKQDGHLLNKWLIPLGLVIGILSSYLGIGGGWLLVPILIYVFKVPTHNAAATSIFSLCLYSTIGVMAQLFYGHVDWPAVIFGGIGVIVGSQIGVLLSQKIPGKVIIQMLSVLLIFIGVRMYFS
ncbi:sulfite exporter TauE/SafE family protein [Neobacillus citreus]|uniref:Probable membrane transporter protein n=1 Tax=Neobacillus citreus TaxID=2833578 RepID=A0A942T2T2_9BACI|nr:sulfite exporter TauE/SafE family protein [Neobacillus citreus]MCH6267227.1 sulfite exporter TauE/SafE family protein [Neobacillus citreus]